MHLLLIRDADELLAPLVRMAQRAFPGASVDTWDPSRQGAPPRGLDWVLYDAVLLDAHPAAADGLEWVRLWRAGAWMMPPVIVLGPTSSDADRAHALASGAADYLAISALSPTTLERAVRRAIATSLITSDTSDTSDISASPSRLALSDTFALPGALSTHETASIVDVETIGQPIDLAAAPPIPGYRIVRRIAIGGMSQVYLAERLSDGQVLVLKLLDPRLAADSIARARFLREHEVLRRVRHPNVVAIYDQAMTDRYAYIAMEYMAGGDLKRRIREGLPPDSIPETIRQMAAGLAAVHGAGIVHRDLKPQNIMFRNADELALADFGLARDVAATSTLTQKGLVLATPLYMSPEQVLGLPHDARGDLYSLGAIVYEIIVGAPPFAGSTAPDLAYQHVHAAPPPLPGRAIGYQTLVSRLLAKKPEDRFQTAGDVLSYLERATA